MIYTYSPYDPEHYATNLRYDAVSQKLMWDTPSGQDVILIRTPYKESAKERMEAVCRGLSQLSALPRQFVEVPGVSNCWVHAVPAVEKVRSKGCPLNSGAGTYTVFSLVERDGQGFIFTPNDQSMITADCHVRMTVHIEVAKEEVHRGGLFRRRRQEDIFYSIAFPAELSSGYIDGDLQYETAGFTVPITAQMVQEGKIYIKTEVRPVIIPQNKGLCLTDDKASGGYRR